VTEPSCRNLVVSLSQDCGAATGAGAIVEPVEASVVETLLWDACCQVGKVGAGTVEWV